MKPSFDTDILRKAIGSRKAAVFFDFDNTIADRDVFDDMLEKFAEGDNWRKLEIKWTKGLIGSRLCLDGQIRCIKADAAALDKYLAGVRIDPYFKRLLNFFHGYGIKPVIVSDNFDYMLGRILKFRGVEGIKVYSNRARLVGDRLRPAYPFTDKTCPSCAHCKKKNLLSRSAKGSIIIYVGDGRSDRCPAKYAHVVFAKGYLLNFCKKEKITYVPFKGLKDVYGYLKKLCPSNKTGRLRPPGPSA